MKAITYTNHRVKKVLILLLLAIATVWAHFDAKAQSWLAGYPLVRNFKTSDYQAGLQNFTIKQDKRGLIYVANNYGLLEYDGTQWQTHGVKSGTKVRSMAIDGKGRIYVGCQGDFGYFFPDAKGKLIYTSLADSLVSRYRNFDETWNIYIDSDKVYFCTFSNLFIYNGKTIEVIKPENPLDYSFLVNRQLFVNQHGVGVSRLEGHALNEVNGGKFFADKSVSSILAMPNDQFIVSTFQHGIFILSNGTVKPWNDTLQKFFIQANINCFGRLKNGNFAMGTQNEGLLELDLNGNLLLQLTRDKGLDSRTVLSIYEDDHNHLWLGQNNTIAFVELNSPFSFIREQNGLPGIGYAAYMDQDRLYLGTNTGLYVRFQKYPDSFSLIENSNGQIYGIGLYGSELLVAHQSGAMRVNANQTTPISKEQGSWVFLPMKNHSDKLLEGTFTGLQLYLKKNNHWQWQKKLSGFSESSRVMAEDQDGKIWVTHGYKGAYRISLNENRDSILNVTFYGSDKGFPTNRLINVFTIRNELLFTSESGSFKYDPIIDRFIPDGQLSKFFGQGSQLWFVQEDALGNIYFIGREHLGVLKKNSVGDYVLYEKEFNKIRKYLNDDLHSIAIMRNNEVIYAAKDGFIHFDPAIPMNQNPIFSTHIRKVTTIHKGDSILFNGHYSVGDSIVERQFKANEPILPYANNSITIAFAATSYESDMDDMLYQYYLEDYEKDWSSWSSHSIKEYTNLPEGSYEFHVRAKNISDEISPEAIYGFTVLAPWYRSTLAYGFYGLVSLSFLILSYKTASRKYKRERNEMVKKQKLELTKKDNEIVNLATQTQSEITRLKNEKLEAEINHTKSELATATMHLLNKNEFIAGIKTNLNHIAQKSTNDELNKELHKIAKDIESNISDDSDWEHFQFHFDRVHGDFTKRLKEQFASLSPQETRLCAYLRMNLSTKEIAHLLNISVRGVEIGRYRLRKKLHLERDNNLQEYILGF